MKHNTNNLEVLKTLKTIQNYVKRRFHPARGAFVLPHISVPACLASKALWAAFISWSFGLETTVSNTVHIIFGAIAGLLFGIGSLWSATSGTNKLLKEIDTRITNILAVMNFDSSSSEGVIRRLNPPIRDIPTKPQPLSWSQIVNVAFAWYTATITSLTVAGAVRDAVKLDPCVPGKLCSGTDAAFLMAVIFAVLWGVCALLLAYYGQREQTFLSQVNNKLKELIVSNSD